MKLRFFKLFAVAITVINCFFIIRYVYKALTFGINTPIFFVFIRLPIMMVLLFCTITIIIILYKSKFDKQINTKALIIVSIISCVLCLCLMTAPLLMQMITLKNVSNQILENELKDLTLEKVIDYQPDTSSPGINNTVRGYKLGKIECLEYTYNQNIEEKIYTNSNGHENDESFIIFDYKIFYMKGVPALLYNWEKQQFLLQEKIQTDTIPYFNKNEQESISVNGVNYQVYFVDDSYQRIVVLADNGQDFILIDFYLDSTEELKLDEEQIIATVLIALNATN